MSTAKKADDTPGSDHGGGSTWPPVGSVDTHFHVFDDRFTTVPGRKRPQATVPEYLAFRKALGIERSVIIAPSSYGLDNACMIDALQRLDSATTRAVAIAGPVISSQEIAQLHRVGVRGIRLFTAHAHFPDEAQLQVMARQLADVGWHLQLVGELENEPFERLESRLSDLPCTLVFDHFGFAPLHAGIGGATVQALHRLLDRGRAYVKLSGLYILSKQGPPDYVDCDDLARDLIARAPERMLWGSDWPHTLAPVRPSGSALLERLPAWAPDLATCRRILVDNPQTLYWSS